MKLITKTVFDNLRLNDEHEYDTDNCGDKKVVKIYCDGKIIAKKISQKKSTRYFGVSGHENFLK